MDLQNDANRWPCIQLTKEGPTASNRMSEQCAFCFTFTTVPRLFCLKLNIISQNFPTSRGSRAAVLHLKKLPQVYPTEPCNERGRRRAPTTSPPVFFGVACYKNRTDLGGSVKCRNSDGDQGYREVSAAYLLCTHAETRNIVVDA